MLSGLVLSLGAAAGFFCAEPQKFVTLCAPQGQGAANRRVEVLRPQGAEPLSATVLEVGGGGAVIDRGTESGITPGMQFNVLSRPRRVRIPGTREEVPGKSEVVARLVITAPSPGRARGQIFLMAAGDRVEPGLRAVRSGALLVIRVRPEILAARTVPERPRWGQTVSIELDLLDPEKELVEYRWRAEVGLFPEGPGGGSAEIVTSRPSVRWICPRDRGRIPLAVEARSAAGAAVKLEFALEAAGEEEAEAPEGLVPDGIYGGMARHFVRVDDLAFDPDGRAYVLDGSIRRVTCLNPDFSLAWSSAQWPAEWRPVRLAVDAQHLYLLDARRREVRRFRLGPGLFTLPAEAVHSAGGKRHLWTAPVALDVGPQGDLFVADAGVGTIRRIGPDGSKSTLGSKGPGTGRFTDLADLAAVGPGDVWALDRSRRKALFFSGSVFIGEVDATGAGDRPVALGRAGAEVWVLGEEQIWKIALGAAPRPVLAGEGHRLLLAGGRDLAGSPRGPVYAVAAEGESILRFSAEGRFTGRWGGQDYSSAERLSVNARGAATLLSRLPALAWNLDREGWVVRVLDLRGIEPADLALADDGTLWLLDAARRRLLSYAGDGAPGIVSLEAQQPLSLAAGKDGVCVLEQRGGLKVHPFDVRGVPGPVVQLAGTEGWDGRRLVLGPDGTRLVWGTDGKCRAFDVAGNALAEWSLPDGVAGAFPGRSRELFSVATGTPAVWLSSERGNRTLRLHVEGVEIKPLDVAGDGYRRLYVLDGVLGRIMRFSPSGPQR